MRAALGIAVLGAVLACGGHVRYRVEFHSTDCDHTGSGSCTGTYVGVEGKLLSDRSAAFEVGLPVRMRVSASSRSRSVLLEARSTARQDERVLDAVATPRGVVALYRRVSGETILALRSGDRVADLPAPSAADRLFLESPLPLRLWLGVPDETAYPVWLDSAHP